MKTGWRLSDVTRRTRSHVFVADMALEYKPGSVASEGNGELLLLFVCGLTLLGDGDHECDADDGDSFTSSAETQKSIT